MPALTDASGQVTALAVHHQYSSSVSPFHANTLAVLPFTTPAAAWSCVEKMLHEHQRTSAPSLASVSMSTAVWIVMCSEPMMRAPANGCAAPYSSRHDIRPGISTSASSMSLRPKSASDMSATLKSPEASTFFAMVAAGRAETSETVVRAGGTTIRTPRSAPGRSRARDARASRLAAPGHGAEARPCCTCAPGRARARADRVHPSRRAGAERDTRRARAPRRMRNANLPARYAATPPPFLKRPY